MNRKPEFEIGLTDEELMEIHLGIREDNLLSKPQARIRLKLAGLLPTPIRNKIIPENKDPLTALPMLGRQLAAAVISESNDIVYHDTEKLATEFLAFSFAKQTCRIAALETGIEAKGIPTKYDEFAQQLAISGQVLAAIFSSENFTPALGRQTLGTMAPKIDELVHPGRRELQEAMERVIRKYEGASEKIRGD